MEEGSEDCRTITSKPPVKGHTINPSPPADITLENKEAVVAARAAYDALTEAQQALVSQARPRTS